MVAIDGARSGYEIRKEGRAPRLDGGRVLSVAENAVPMARLGPMRRAHVRVRQSETDKERDREKHGRDGPRATQHCVRTLIAVNSASSSPDALVPLLMRVDRWMR
jgi:hypothetical protein